MAQASVAVRSARVYLNDLNGITWTDSILMALLQEAHGELNQELDLNGSSTIKVQTNPLIIPAGSIDMAGQQPANIINPISMKEGDIGTDPEFMEDMEKVTFLPQIDQTNWLTYWSWIGDSIAFLGSTADRQVILRYEGLINTPQKLTDNLGCIFAERFIGPRIAALAYASIGKDNSRIQEIADKNLYKLIQAQVVNDQRPVRHRAYRSPKGFLGGFTVPISISGPGSGNAVQFIPTTTPPDGIRTGFVFPFIPKVVIYNGVTQFLGLGYTLAVVAGKYTVTLQDILGNVITPDPTDDIREEV